MSLRCRKGSTMSKAIVKGFAWAIVPALVVAVAGRAGAEQDPSRAGAEQSRRILETTGVKGGLVVHVGCGDGRLTAALRVSSAYLVHGLDRDAANVAKARAHIRSKGLYGPVSVDRFDGRHLPYTDNLVRLVVADVLGDVPMAEVMRVLCPGGVVIVKQGDAWKTTRKPWPAEIDEWTHALHDPSNNAVSHDTVVGPPGHLQWMGGPSWARSHDHLSSVSVVVSSAGRVFAIVDEGPAAAVALPARWRLVARDAFNGVVLWKRTIDPWEGHLRSFRTGPAAIQRRLVAVGETVYVTLGYGKPVTALDAATGEIKRTYEGTDDALEIVCADGVLYVVTGPTIGHGAAKSMHKFGGRVPYVSPGGKKLLAIEAETGKRLWLEAGADTSRLMPTALAVAGGRLFYQNTQELICLDARTGRERWRADRPVTTSRWAWSAPTLVAYGDVVLSADRDATSQIPEEGATQGKVLWIVYGKGGEAPPGELIAFSAQTGERLWASKAREAYNAPVDVLVADGLVWTGVLVRAKEPGITQGLDPATGEVKRTRPPDSEFFHVGMGHHRCYRNKATDRFLVLGRSGVEWIDVKTGEGISDHWFRGACQYGVMPCNGLLYVPSHSCACYIEAKLNGFIALGPKRSTKSEGRSTKRQERLIKGGAYGVGVSNTATSAGDWPTYRHDGARTGCTPLPVSVKLGEAWRRDLGGELTSLVVADGKVFLAQVQTHTVHALDAATGRPVWSRTVGGRVDSPPTVYGGLCLFGCRDGTVYCLRASDGELVWRFRAAPEDRRIVAYNQLESAWPVHGNILIHNGSAYFAAGRCAYVDGGMVLYRLDPATGKVQIRKPIYSRDPETDREPQEHIKGVSMPGALPDVLSSDGKNIYMRHRRFDADLNELKPHVPHLFCGAGFLDGSWWHRTYYMFGTRMTSGWGGWTRAGYVAPAGRLMVVDDASAYAFGRLNQYSTAGTHVGLPPNRHPWGALPKQTPYYVLFASGKEPELIETKADAKKGGKKRRPAQRRLKPRWTQSLDLWVRAMVLAGDTLFLAGPPDPFGGDEPDAGALEGKRGGILRIVSSVDGGRLAEYRLSAPPAWDAMVAAGGRLYLATTDGGVTCMKGK